MPVCRVLVIPSSEREAPEVGLGEQQPRYAPMIRATAQQILGNLVPYLMGTHP